MAKRVFSYKIEYEADKSSGQIVAMEALIKAGKKVPEPTFKTEGTYLKVFTPA